MTAPTLNLPLAEAVLEQITKHPETHDQATFGYRSDDRGTTYCIAGWAIVLSPEVEPQWRSSFHGGEELGVVRFVAGLGFYTPYEAGQILLGLDDDEADRLFLVIDDDEAECVQSESVEFLKMLIADARLVTA